MAKSKRRFTNFFYILVTLCLVLVAKVQSSEDSRVKRKIVAMCPPTFQKIRTECYHISSYPLTWLEAHFECKSKNGKLAEPTRVQDHAIRNFLLNKYASERDEIYFGGMFDHLAKEWSWGVSGQKFNYTSFIGMKTYLKRKTLDYTCTVYNPRRKFRWTPRDCTEQHRFICEHKMPKVSDKNREKIYQRWNITYPNQFANEVVMEVRQDDKHSNSRRVKVVSESGEEFYLKRTPHPHRDGNQPLMQRPTYNTPTPVTKRPNNDTPAPVAKHPNDVLNDGGNSVDNNEILKPTKNPKKDRSRNKFDKEVARLRRVEKSAKREEKLRRLREKEELIKRKEQENQSKNLEVQREKEENERKRLHEERIREQEERRRLEETARREEEQRQRLEDTLRREERERQQLEDERRLQDDSKRQKRLEVVPIGEFVPEVITEDYRAIEQRKLETQKEVEKLEREIKEKYEREQEQELAIQKMEQEKHIKELEEKELARRAEEQRRRDEKERERLEYIRQAEETAKRIEEEKRMDAERRIEEEEYKQRLEKEKQEREQQEKMEKERREKEVREREEEEKKRKAKIQEKVDAEKDEIIEQDIRKQEKEERKKEMLRKLSKLTPEQREKFLELKRKKKAKLSKTANEVTGDDKK